MSRAIILMLDSLGIGSAPDAAKFGDVGANTFASCAQYCASQHRTLSIPNLSRLGLVKAAELSAGHPIEGTDRHAEIISTYAACNEISFGKDTPSGHWEMAGSPVLFDWGLFPEKKHSFPQTLTDAILKNSDISDFLGNCHASGTTILDELGEHHIKSGHPIFYTSADSVFQIACHEQLFGLERLYRLCEVTREILMDYNIGRVIARPFIGEEKGHFERTGNRRDYSIKPPSPTILDKLIDEKQGSVYAIGKIADIYAHCGISHYIKATGFDELFNKTLNSMQEAPSSSIIFTNFVDFDSHFGHRRNVQGYANALETFDQRLPEILQTMQKEDVLYITADHGCDPTWHGSDHTRERVPVLIYGSHIPSGSAGIRETFADIGQTIAKQLALSPMPYGTVIQANT